MRTLIIISLIIASTACSPTTTPQTKQVDLSMYDSIDYSPESYICYKTYQQEIVDGDIYSPQWEKAEWTKLFVDIEGDKKPNPRYDTRVKMMWDDTYFYIAAELKEPHIWATLTERESVIFHDNDFEVFIDPDADTHNYMEYEVNAFGTEWDLMLLKPYRDGATVLNCWNINGIKTAIKIYGTINNPKDTDDKWCIEIAMPIASLTEAASARKPASGVQWKVNFSRVEWFTDIVDGKYAKVANPYKDEQHKMSEDNWVWSSQGKISMHEPETWGIVQFSDKTVTDKGDTYIQDVNERIKWELRKLYFKQRAFRNATGYYSDDVSFLGNTGNTKDIKLYTTPGGYHIIAPGADSSKIHIRDDGKTWESK